jgi:hypothetical protein
MRFRGYNSRRDQRSCRRSNRFCDSRLATRRVGASLVLFVAAVAGLLLATPTVAQASERGAHQWSILPSPTTSSNEVSCVDRDFCVSVGSTTYFDSEQGRTVTAPTIETWDGRRWVGSTPPNPTSSLDASLSGVSCASRRFCVAVGSSLVAAGQVTLIVTWNGHTWSATPVTNPGRISQLFKVSCTSAKNCMAVGYWVGAMCCLSLADSWNGTIWSYVPSPELNYPFGQALFLAVGCISRDSCTATGTSTKYGTLTEWWDGSSWSIVPSPSIGTPTRTSTVCFSTVNCFAVGSSGTGEALIESWNGSGWSAVPSPSFPQSSLNDISCLSVRSCTAVGSYIKDSKEFTLIEIWNGRFWSVSRTRNVPESDGLGNVSCVPATGVCTAVGDYLVSSSTVIHTLVEVNNGRGTLPRTLLK